MIHRHIVTFSTSFHHTSPLVESSQFHQQVLLGDKEIGRLLIGHTANHSSLAFAHIVAIFGNTA